MLSKVYKEVAEELGLDEQLVKKTYSGYWLFVKEVFGKLPLKGDVTEEDFNKMRTSVNVPHIGKMAILKDKFFNKKKLNSYLRHDENKED